RNLQYLVKKELRWGRAGSGRLLQGRAHDQADEVVPLLLHGEFDRKAVVEFADDAPDAGADRKRGSDRWVVFAGYGDAGRGDVDDEAGMDAAVGERQERVRDLRNE